MTRKLRARIPAAAAAVAAAVLVVVAYAGATPARPRPSGPATQLYWSEPATSRGPAGSGINTIWRANLGGSGIKRNFVHGLSSPGAVAVAGTHVYWSDDEAGTIGRGTLNGTHVQPSFIHETTDALAVTRQFIYFVTTSDFKSFQMWRANLSGSHVHELFPVGTGGYFGGLVATGSHLYWSNRDKGTIGRADINGTHVQPGFITGLKDPNGLTASRTDLYWASTDPGVKSNSIGRASLDGTHVKPGFITGASYPFGVAVGAGHLYWTNYDAGTIGRADINGTHVQQHFISAYAYYMTAAPLYIAVGP